MYNNDFEENINNQEEVKEEIKQNEVEENKNNEVEETVEEKKDIEIEIEDIDGTEEEKKANWNKMTEEKNAYKEELNDDKTKKKKRTYKDFGLTPAQVLKFTKMAENDLKIEEIEKDIKLYVKKLGVDISKTFLETIKEDIKNTFEILQPEEQKKKEEEKKAQKNKEEEKK